MEFLKFIFSSFWVWLGFDTYDVWTDCDKELPKADGLYYIKKDNTNSMWLCRYNNGKFTLSMYPEHEVKAIKWADYGAFESE